METQKQYKPYSYTLTSKLKITNVEISAFIVDNNKIFDELSIDGQHLVEALLLVINGADLKDYIRPATLNRMIERRKENITK